MPLLPSGLRTMHLAGGGLLLGLLTPLGLLFGMVKYDPRVRSARQIERDAGVKVLSTMPVYRTQQRRRQTLRNFGFAAMLFLIVPALYVLTYTLRYMDVL